ncbi:MAG: hypothetical protein EF813_11950 [Methanosarcinales archaeon]|nr:MAG: hypothetical protein EF813_11950 [Methanosarcinales archaeon]
MNDAIINSGRWNTNDSWFKYYNSTGALVFSAYIDAVFPGTESYVVQLMHATQYSEIDGSVLMEFREEDKKTVSAGSATTILPLIIAPLDGQIFVEGGTIAFSASASDGMPPYSYTWYEKDNIIGTGNSFDTSFDAGSHTITLIVTDAAGRSVSEQVRIRTGLQGDINHDGIITTTDAAIASWMTIRGEWDWCADVNDDGEVTSLDALMLLQAADGTIES